MLSVITITYNNFHELVSTIGSIPHGDVQIVVVNGGQDPQTEAYLATSSATSVSEKDKGISDAFNKGFNLSKGEFVTYLNSGDILIDKTYYNDAVFIFESDPTIDYIYADISFIDSFAGNIHVRSNQSFPSMPYLHPTLIVRRKTFESIGMFDESFKVAMDLDFAYRLFKSGAKGHYIPRMVTQMDGRGVSSIKFTSTYLENLKVILKNKDFSFRSMVFLIKNGFLLGAKILLLKCNGNKLLGWYRKKKYGLSSR
jgi:glycosyltransferase involved in cell wall biosynthesis